MIIYIYMQTYDLFAVISVSCVYIVRIYIIQVWIKIRNYIFCEQIKLIIRRGRLPAVVLITLWLTKNNIWFVSPSLASDPNRKFRLSTQTNRLLRAHTHIHTTCTHYAIKMHNIKQA